MTKTLGEAGETFQSEAVSRWGREGFRGGETLTVAGWFETKTKREPTGGRANVNSMLPAAGDCEAWDTVSSRWKKG